MICLDTSFVIDYWNGEPYTKAYLENTDETVGIPAIAMFELYLGAVLSDSPTEDISTVVDDLFWANRIEFDDGAAQEAARIDAELSQRGEPINLGDVLIAATARSLRVPLITVDQHFERFPNLEVHNPSGENPKNG